MRVVFADTGYWIAFLNPHDDLHDKALNLSKAVQPAHIVTTEMVLVEVLNDFSDRGEYFRQSAVNLIRMLYQHPNTTVIPQTSVQFQSALTLYEQRPDKEWSQTDCVSFKIMEDQSIVDALAYDKHFAQAGFTALMRNCRM
ncbi:nucleic acid-binding protein [Candidatus Synechococcus calcipolaris G9]|uniref:Nucleic acid-binding protein n=1 Tax=Candidatus Synechococcus calcipolaris G9 TaxID=1497997 RepID=A0ABT6EXR2_9SYNE|nr:nucleic acid-binding protein [Candidatus Synechococcus calcipolaris]MDG2990600.1 nucleic acid-binding protein [Candidatus Synechococcus calcipolaris G9]